MNILPLINDFLNNFNKNFENKTNLYELETYIVSQGDKLTKKLLIAFIEGIDLEYKFSKVRKEKYTVKETRNRILLTSIGYINVKFTFYKDRQKLLLNNLDGIKNQHHELYNCPCSMEGHVSNKYARYITSSPYAFSLEGLQNKLQLLVLRANKVNLTFEDYLYLKYSDNEHDEINDKIKKFKTNFKLTINQYEHKNNGLGISLPILDSYKDNNYIKELLSPRHRIRYI